MNEVILSLVELCQKLKVNLLLVMFCVCVLLINLIIIMIVYYWHKSKESKWYLNVIFWFLILMLYAVTFCIYLRRNDAFILLVGLGLFPSIFWLYFFVFESDSEFSFNNDLDPRLVEAGAIFFYLTLGEVISYPKPNWYFLLGFILTHIFSSLIICRVAKSKLEKYKNEKKGGK